MVRLLAAVALAVIAVLVGLGAVAFTPSVFALATGITAAGLLL